MDKTATRQSLFRLLAGFAAGVIILAGVKSAAPIIVPFLLAGFIAMLCSIPLFWLHRKGVPNVLSVLIIVLTLLGLGTAMVITAGSSLKSFSNQLPLYRQSLQLQGEQMMSIIGKMGINIDAYQEELADLFNPSTAMDVAGVAIKSASGLLTNGFMVMLTIVFILLEAVAMPTKLKKVLPDSESTFMGFREFVASVKRYLIIKTLISIATGLLVGIWLSLLGLDFPILWALLAMAFNFVPTIGSIIAAIPAILMGIVQMGPSAIISVGICFLTVNIALGSILEPRIMGEGLGLSALVVFLSLVFWGWLLGPVGMLLSVPLTMIVKIACLSNEGTRHIGILLGPPDGGLPPGGETDKQQRQENPA